MLGKENSIFKIKKNKVAKWGFAMGLQQSWLTVKKKKKYINYTQTTTKDVNAITALLGVPQEESWAASQLALRVGYKLHAYIT